MGIAKNDAMVMTEANSVMWLGGGSASSNRWVKRLKTSSTSSLKRSFTKAFIFSSEPMLKKRAKVDFTTLLKNAVASATAYESWIRRWQPMPPQVMTGLDGKQQLVPSVAAMALMGRSMGYSQYIRVRKSISLVAWA